MNSISSPSAPKAIGPYSQAIVAGGFVFCSGQLGLDPVSGQFAAADTAAQVRQALQNLAAVLEAAGSGLRQVVKTTVFLADMNDFTAMNAEYEKVFGAHKPARSTVEVKRLPKDARVEIECIAVV
jgi:2-iminobutanoate/2-iminopropanoate deaminase